MKWFQKKRRPATYSRSYWILADNAGRVMSINYTTPAAIVLMNEMTPDTYYASNVNYPRYPDPFFLASADPRTYPEWTWHWERGFTRTSPELVTPELREKARFLSKKTFVLSQVMRELSRIREKVSSGVSFQETVYAQKRREAEAFRDAGYKEENLIEYPLLVQYADLVGIPLRDAAEDILFKVKLDMDHLAKTEQLRLTYFNKIKEASSIPELNELLRTFYRDCYTTATL